MYCTYDDDLMVLHILPSFQENSLQDQTKQYKHRSQPPPPPIGYNICHLGRRLTAPALAAQLLCWTLQTVLFK